MEKTTYVVCSVYQNIPVLTDFPLKMLYTFLQYQIFHICQKSTPENSCYIGVWAYLTIDSALLLCPPQQNLDPWSLSIRIKKVVN